MTRSLDRSTRPPWLCSLLLLACSQSPSGFTPPPPVPASGGAGPADPPPGPPPAVVPEPADEAPAPVLGPSEPIGTALRRVPETIAALYVLSISEDRQQLTIDPRPRPTRRDTRSRGFTVEDSANGGKIIALEGGPFRNAGWVRATFRERVSAQARLQQLRAAGYDLDQPRDLLVVDGEADPSPTLFAFSADAAKPGIVGVCSDVTIIDFAAATPPRPIAVRKPVVYLYPLARTRVRVGLQLRGELLAAYPALHDGAWTITAEPDGTLVDETTGRRHRYLFWEGSSADWVLDPARAHCVPGADAAPFLERVCDAYALTADECGDFVTYWLPTLARNPYTVVQLVDEEVYGRYARLSVEPAPDTVIRPFMILRRSEAPVDVGAPPLPQRHREGFTVVEWGGADLDAPLPEHARPR